MKPIAALGLFALIAPLLATPALAQSDEAIRTRQIVRGAPIAEPGSVLDQYRRLPDALDDDEAVVVRRRCAAPDDGKPHGEVHVEDKMPAKSTVMGWLVDKVEFRQLFATRGGQLVDCDARRRLAIDTAVAEHALQDQFRAEQLKRARPWWRFWVES